MRLGVQQADVGLGVCLATAGDDPEVAVEEGLEPVGRQCLHVRVCQSGEHREMKRSRTSSQVPLFTGVSINVCISHSVR